MIRNPVLGSIAGDMIGVPYEFLRHGVNVSPDFPLWSDNSTFSDYSVMTLAIAKWLTEDYSFSVQALIDCMVTLGRKYRNRGYGGKGGEGGTGGAGVIGNVVVDYGEVDVTGGNGGVGGRGGNGDKRTSYAGSG